MKFKSSLAVLALCLGMVWYQAYELRKARVINEVFRVYFRDVLGMNLNFDLIYEDGKKWVGKEK